MNSSYLGSRIILLLVPFTSFFFIRIVHTSSTSTSSATNSVPQLDQPVEHVSQVEEIIEEMKLRNATSFNNLTRCSSTELTLSKESLLYTWEMKGFLGYYVFMKRFTQIFELKTEEVSFKSDIVDGKWFFKLSKIATSPGQEELVLTTTYSYESKQAKKLNFHIQLSIIHEDKEIVLPIQKSSSPVVMQQRLYNRRGYSSYFEYVHTFTWSHVDQAMENIIKQQTSSQSNPSTSDPTADPLQQKSPPDDESKDTFGESNEDILLRFLITSYFPSDPVYSGSENCQSVSSGGSISGLVRDGDSRSKRSISPPYVKHANSMLHDERFADVLLKSGDQEYHAHRIILASSSPVFSALLHNDSIEVYSNSAESSSNTTESMAEPLTIHLEISPDVTAEMLRYIYTGRANEMDKLASKLIVAAHIYGLPDLKRLCEKILFSKIRPGNAIEMYSLGHEVSSTILTRKAFAIMKVNKSKIVSQSEEFRQLTSKHPSLMFELFLS